MNLEKLRFLAEERYKKTFRPQEVSASNPDLLHELQVQQIELETQNESLRQAQIDLEKSHERYVDLYEFAPVGYLTLTRSGLVAAANLTVAIMLGLERGSLVDCRFATFVADTDRDPWDRFFFQALKQTGDSQFDVTLRRKDQKLLQVHANFRSVISDGAMPVLRMTLTDVTTLKRAEETTLREDTLRRSAIFDGAPDGIVIVDVETGRVVDGNPSACAMLGYQRSELLSLNIQAIYQSVETAKVFGACSLPDSGSGHAVLETAVTRKDGNSFQAAISMSRLEVQGRSRVICFARDVTERRLAEAALRESEWTLRSALKFSPNPIFIAAANHRFCFVSLGAENLLGYTQNELLQMAIEDILAPEGFENALLSLQNGLKGGSGGLFQAALLHKNNSRVDVQFNGVHLPTGNVLISVRGTPLDASVDRSSLSVRPYEH